MLLIVAEGPGSHRQGELPLRLGVEFELLDAFSMSTPLAFLSDI